jgi:acetyltransferase-like isoleucine patch superfamily enzyme
MSESQYKNPISQKLATLFENRQTEAISKLDLEQIEAADWKIFQSNDPELQGLGIRSISGQCAVAVRATDKPLGVVNLAVGGTGSLVVFDNHAWSGTINTNIRISNDGCFLFFGNLTNSVLNLTNIFMRSKFQNLFFGYDASAVAMNIEMEGENRTVMVGDDLLASSDIWIRNADMHAIFDLDNFQLINGPSDTLIERHVWLSQSALILNCRYIGGGSIVGAKAMVKKEVPRLSVVGGVPHKVLRKNTSWGRAVSHMTPSEREVIEMLRSLPPIVPPSA